VTVVVVAAAERLTVVLPVLGPLTRSPEYFAVTVGDPAEVSEYCTLQVASLPRAQKGGRNEPVCEVVDQFTNPVGPDEPPLETVAVHVRTNAFGGPKEGPCEPDGGTQETVVVVGAVSDATSAWPSVVSTWASEVGIPGRLTVARKMSSCATAPLVSPWLRDEDAALREKSRSDVTGSGRFIPLTTMISCCVASEEVKTEKTALPDPVAWKRSTEKEAWSVYDPSDPAEGVNGVRAQDAPLDETEARVQVPEAGKLRLEGGDDGEVIEKVTVPLGATGVAEVSTTVAVQVNGGVVEPRTSNDGEHDTVVVVGLGSPMTKLVPWSAETGMSPQMV
jgi:hypothetical protein